MKNKKLKIRVVGLGCTNCKTMYDLTVKAVKELNIDAEVEYDNDIQDALYSGVINFPVVEINGKMTIEGLSDIEKIKEVLTENAK